MRTYLVAHWSHKWDSCDLSNNICSIDFRSRSGEGTRRHARCRQPHSTFEKILIKWNYIAEMYAHITQ